MTDTITDKVTHSCTHMHADKHTPNTSVLRFRDEDGQKILSIGICCYLLGDFCKLFCIS